MVEGDYGIGCILSNNTLLGGHLHAWLDTSPTIAEGTAVNARRVCGCQAKSYHWAELAFSPCDVCRTGQRTGDYVCVDDKEEMVEARLCPPREGIIDDRVPNITMECGDGGCQWQVYIGEFF